MTAAPVLAPPAATCHRASRLMPAVALVGFVTTLDGTIVAAAAPSIGRELGLSLGTLQWISIGYLLPYAGLLLPAGALLDRLGRRRLLLGGCAVFAAGALLGGVARSAELLLVARVAQGAAAAFIVPGVLSLIRTELPASRRPAAIGVWTAALACALALGPWVGGVFAEHLHWSWIFLCNIPFVAAAWGLLAALPTTEPRRPERRAAPLIPVALRSNRVFVGANALVVLWGLGISGLVFFTPLMFQDALGMGPAAAGLPLVIVAGGMICATPLVPAAIRAFGARRVVSLGLFVLAIGLVQLAVVNDESTLAPRIAGLVLAGVGSAFTAPITGHALDLVGEDDTGTAAGVLTAARELSGAAGVALTGLVLTSVRDWQLAGGAAPGPALGSGYAAGLLVAAVLQAAAAGLALVVLRPARESEET